MSVVGFQFVDAAAAFVQLSIKFLTGLFDNELLVLLLLFKSLIKFVLRGSGVGDEVLLILLLLFIFKRSSSSSSSDCCN